VIFFVYSNCTLAEIAIYIPDDNCKVLVNRESSFDRLVFKHRRGKYALHVIKLFGIFAGLKITAIMISVDCLGLPHITLE